MDKPELGMTMCFSAEERVALRDIVRERIAGDNLKKAQKTGDKVIETAVLPYHQSTLGISVIMKYFAYEHLPEELQKVSKPICDVARMYEEKVRPGAEKSAGLRKLLEAKDCMVRAAL